MQSFTHKFCALFILFFSLWLCSFAQFENAKGVELKLISSVYLKKTDTAAVDATGGLIFRNISKIDFYEDEYIRDKIKKAKQENNLTDQDKYLTRYVSRFGIENFRKDPDLLWKLGEVRQLQQDTIWALALYEMAIKHSTYRPKTGMARYDALREPTKSDWIELDRYFELLELRKKVDKLIPPKKVLQSMGDKINSVGPDYAPFMHPSDSVLIFTSRRDETNLIDDIFASKNEDIYYAMRSFHDGKWQYAERLDININSELNEGSACLSPDGKVLFFTRCNAVSSVGDCDIYMSRYRDGHWSKPKNLGRGVNSKSWDSHPNITPDGQTLFFASNRNDGFGGTDVYFSTLQEDSTWGKAENLGPLINTPANEITPFYHRINQTLYFSSNGQMKTFGGYDIYKSPWMGNRWDQPRNLGPLVNTSSNEDYFTIDGQGKTIFYSRSKSAEGDYATQDFDLYSFEMPMEARPDANATLKGYLIDSVTNKPLVGTVMLVDLDEGIEIAPKKINDNGYFEFDLIPGHEYRVYVIGENYLTIKRDVELEEDSVFTIFTQSVDKNQPIVFESLEFEENSYQLGKKSLPKLDYLAHFLRRYPQFRLVIKGHTDSDGTEQYNYELSLRRAEQIRDYIQSRGKGDIPEGRVIAMGFGETRPLVPNDTEENKELNRRVEFELLFDEDYKKRTPEEEEPTMPMEDELFFDDDFYEEEPDDLWDDLEDDLDWGDDDLEDWDDWLMDDDDLDLDDDFDDLDFEEFDEVDDIDEIEDEP